MIEDKLIKSLNLVTTLYLEILNEGMTTIY